MEGVQKSASSVIWYVGWNMKHFFLSVSYNFINDSTMEKFRSNMCELEIPHWCADLVVMNNFMGHPKHPTFILKNSNEIIKNKFWTFACSCARTISYEWAHIQVKVFIQPRWKPPNKLVHCVDWFERIQSKPADIGINARSHTHTHTYVQIR